MNPWQELGVAPTADVRAIKRAYAVRLKQVRPDADPEGFQALRAAYERALALANQAAAADAATAAPSVDAPPPAAPPDAAVPVDVPAPVSSPSSRTAPAFEPPAIRLPAPAEAAARVLQRLVALPPAQHLDALRTELRQEGWEQIDFQFAIQCELIELLHRHFDEALNTIEAIAQYYGWNDSQRRVGGDLRGVPELAGRYNARLARLAIEREGGARAEAFRWLQQPVDERAFRGHAWSGKNLQVLDALLGSLRREHPGVLHYECERAAVAWWIEYVDSVPVTRDSFIAPLVIGGLLALVAIAIGASVLHQHYGGWSGAPAWVASLAAMAVLVLPLGLKLLQQAWQRRVRAGLLQRIDTERQRWIHEPRRRNALYALAVLSVVLSPGTAFHPAFLGVHVICAALLLLWYGLRYTASVMLLLVWPLYVILGGSLQGLYGLLPTAPAWFPKEALFSLPHLLGSYGYGPFVRACGAIKEKLSGLPPADPGRFAWYVSLGLLVLALVGDAMIDAQRETGLGQESRPSVQATETAALRAQRRDIRIQIKARGPAHQLILESFYPRPVPEARLTLLLTVSDQGQITRAQVVDTSFDNREFERRLIDYLKSQQYAGNTERRSLDLKVVFTDTRAVPLSVDAATAAPLTPRVLREDPPAAQRVQRPLKEIQQQQARDTERFNRALLDHFPDRQPPADATLTVVLVIAPDGRVTEARIEDSTYANPEFEAALIREVKKTRYKSDENYLSTEFSYQFKTRPPKPARPLSDIQAQREELLARIREHQSRVFADQAPPPGAKLRIDYVVQPDGRVTDATVAASSYAKPPFEFAVRDEIGRMRFPASTEYGPSRYSFEYGALDAPAEAVP